MTQPKQQFLKKDFTLVVIGQIISLFGNQILHFALPLYLLNQTGSAALFGVISACSFIPMILLSPIGGIIADRVNKRNIMVILDFSTAGITLLFTLLLGHTDLIILILVMLILLYGIQGAYQPAVQASVPVLMDNEHLMQGNAAINLVSSLAGLIGPVIGGAVFGFWGIYPILYAGIVCFFISAVMEIFIHIPFEKRSGKESIIQICKKDLKESFLYLRYKQPVIWKVTLLVACVNLFFSSLINIGLPVIVTQLLGFSEAKGNQLYGYAQGALAAGGLLGGLLAGVLSRKLRAKNSWLLLIFGSVTLLPVGISLMLPLSGILVFSVLVVCCFIIMATASLFSIQIISYLQMITPVSMLGKIISCVMCICMCAQPIGQALYGILFEKLKENAFINFFAACIIVSLIAYFNRKTFREMDSLLSDNS